MAKEDVIDHYVDEKGVIRQADVMVEQIQRIHKHLLDLNKVEVSLGKVSGSKELKTLTNELIASQKKLEESTIKLASVQEQLARARAKEDEAKRRGKRTTDENISATEREAKAQLDNIKAKQNATKYETALQKEIDKTNKARVKEEERLGKLNSAYDQLKAKYAIAANTAKQLAAAKGLENEETKEAIAVAERYYQELLKIEKAVGQSQRQVGDYRQATFALNQVLREAPAFANSFATGISGISNNVPMLVDEFKKLRVETGSNMAAFRVLLGGFASFTTILPIAFLLIQSYSKEITGFVSSLFSAKGAIDETRKSQEFLNEAFEDTDFKNAIKTVEELTLNVDLAKKGFISKKEVVNQYNETMGKTTGQLTDFADVERRIVEAGPAYIKMMLFRAAANAAVEEAAKKALEAEKSRQKLFATEEKKEVSLPGGTLDLNKVGNQNKPITAIGAINAQTEKDIKVAEKQGNEYEKIAKSFLEKAGNISKDFNFSLLGGEYDDDTAKASTEDFKKGLAKQREELEKALAEITRSRLEAERDSGLAIGQDEARSFDMRLEGYRTFYNKALELLRFNTAAEMKAIADKATEEARQVNEQLKAKNLTASQRQDLQATLIAIDKTAAVQKLAVEANYNRDVIKLNETSEKQISEFAKASMDQREKDRIEAIRKQKDALTEELNIQASYLNTLKNNDIADLNKRLSSNLLTVEQYNQERRAIEDRYQKEAAASEIAVLEQQLKFFGYTEEERAKIIERISALQVDATKSRVDQEIDKLKQLERAEEELAEKRKRLGLEIYDALVSVNSARFDQEKERNDEQIRMIDERAAREKNTIQQTVTNTVQRDQQIAEVEARTQAQKEQMERRNEALEKRKASFEKAAAITRIAIETVLAVLKLKAQAAVYAGAVLTAPLAAIPLAQIPVVIAGGAIAAGAIAAKKFFKGKTKGEHYEGYGIVGDGGKSELIIREDGTMEVTPDTDTLTYIRPKDVILPDAEAALKNGAIELNKTLQYSDYAKVNNSINEAKIVDGIVRGINSMKQDVVHAVENIPQPIIQVENVVKRAVRSGGSLIEYLNKYGR